MPRRRSPSSSAAWRTRSSPTLSKTYAYTVISSVDGSLSLLLRLMLLLFPYDWQQAYHLDPQRIDRIFTVAKLRFLESAYFSSMRVCVMCNVYTACG